MGKKSRTKGHSFERETAIALRLVFPDARRLLENHKDDAQGVDILNPGSFKFQCKRFKKYAPLSCIREVVCDRELGDIPVLVTKGDHEETLCALPMEDFLWLLSSALAR